MKYLDFEMMFLRSGEQYMAHIVQAPGGNASVTFNLPFDRLELEEFLLRMGQARRGPAEMEAARRFGGRLFETVFDAEMRGCLRSSLDQADRDGAGLRIRLRFEESAAELSDLPWEFLYYEALDRFFALSPATPIVRYLEMPERIEPLRVSPPLRVLVMIAAPVDQPPLDAEKEWQGITDALRDLQSRGLVTVKRAGKATLAALQNELREGQYNVFHFIGHGMFDRASQDGVLLLEKEDHTGDPVSGRELGTFLHGHHWMRLAILSACEGARASRENRFRGVAQSLIRQGIPAVIAMQFKVSDDAAAMLTREFYDALADGFPVDAALAEGRKAVYGQGDNVEWGTPVLYLRAPDGRIFDSGREEAEVSERERDEEEREPSISIRIGGIVSGTLRAAGRDIVETHISSVDGDVVQGDKIIQGDQVVGDKITTGDITGSTGVAIGSGASATATQGTDPAVIARVFDQLLARLDQVQTADPQTIADARDTVEEIRAEARKGEQADESFLAKRLRNIARMGPDILDVVTATLANPAMGLAKVVQLVARKAREDAGLEPV